MGKLRLSLRPAMLALIALSIAGVSQLGWWYGQAAVERAVRVRFEKEILRIADNVQDHMERYTQALVGLQGLFAASVSVDRDEWSAYVRSIMASGELSETRAFRYLERVISANAQTFVEEVRQDTNLPEEVRLSYQIRPEGPREEYFPIKYNEPFDHGSLGFDYGTLEARRLFMDQARDSGQPVATGKLLLLEDYKQGFLVFLPIYENGADTGSVEARRAALRGYVAGVFHYDRILSSVLGRETHGASINVEVFDGEEPAAEQLIFDADPSSLDFKGDASNIADMVRVRVAGRPWLLYFTAQPGFGSGQPESYLPRAGAMIGGLLSTLLWTVFYTLYRSRQRAVELAKEMTQDLAESEARYRGLVEMSPDAIFIQSEGEVVFANPAMAKLLGAHAASDIVGNPVLEYIHPEYRELARSRTENMRTGKDAPIIEEKFLRMDGRSVYVEVAARPMIYKGKPATQVVARDMTEKKRLEGQLIQSQKMDTVGTLAGGIAHDLNNQLTPLIGYIDLILRQTDPKSPAFPFLTEANQSASRCAEVVQRLVGFARPSTQEKRLLRFQDLFKELAQLLAQFLPSTISIDISCDDNTAVIMGNDTDIITVFMNLAANARDAMPEGGKLVIRAQNTTAASKNLDGVVSREYVVVTVTDTGSGISSSALTRIFEPFFTTKSRGRGTGLGLTMVFNIVKAHAGWIDVSSVEGKGASFHIFLPAGADKAAVESKNEPTVLIGGVETVLFADDEEPLRNLGRTFLERLGYRVILASDGEEAVRIYKEKTGVIDAVILDMTMPKMNGRQTLEKILSINPKARVILISGYTSEGMPQDLVKAGAGYFMPKPYTILLLSQSLRKVLDARG